jgi:hypothetical protein
LLPLGKPVEAFQRYSWGDCVPLYNISSSFVEQDGSFSTQRSRSWIWTVLKIFKVLFGCSLASFSSLHEICQEFSALHSCDHPFITLPTFGRDPQTLKMRLFFQHHMINVSLELQQTVPWAQQPLLLLSLIFLKCLLKTKTSP